MIVFAITEKVKYGEKKKGHIALNSKCEMYETLFQHINGFKRNVNTVNHIMLDSGHMRL